jgi:hypothetical protein
MTLHRCCAVLTLLAAVACDRGAEGVAESPSRSTPTPSSGGDRETEARAMFAAARSAPIPDKVDLLRRVTALYDDLPVSADAHFELVFYLRLDPRESTPRAALEAVKRFAERKPSDVRVSEGFKLVAQSAADTGYDALQSEALSAWDAWLADRFAKQDAASGVLHADAAHALMLRRRWADAEPHVVAAVGAPQVEPGRRLVWKVLLGDLRGQRLADVAGARAAWFEALRDAPLGPEAARQKSMAAEAIAAHLVADQLRAVNAAFLRATPGR